MAQLRVGNPVTGNDFVGREDEIKYILELLRLGQNIVLIAPRRYGKTSLILEILSKIQPEDTYSAFIDIFSIPNLEILSSQIAEAVLKNHKLDTIFAKTKNSALAMIQNLSLKAAIEDFEFIIGFSERKENNWELLEKSIDFIDQFAEKHQKKMVCVFDEFGDIKKLDGNQIVKLFRSKLQLHKNTSYIFSGSYESAMSNLFIEKNAPFFRFARVINLGKIEKTKFLSFYKTQIDKYQIDFNEDELKKILDFTGGHPYYSQLALQEIIIFTALNNKPPLYSEILSLMLNSEKNYIEKTWEEFSATKEIVKTILAVIQDDKKPYSSLKNSGINIYRALKTLVMNGTLFKTENGFELSDPLLQLWIEINILQKI